MEKEYLDVLDLKGNKKGIIKLREDIHQDGDIHRVIHIWIYNDKQELLLQKRSETCENHPLCWDISCAGHVHALECSIDGALRELHEELGLDIKEDQLTYLTTIERLQNPQNQELADIYLLKLNLNPKKVRFPDHEVASIRYFTIPQIERFIEKQDPSFIIREEYPFIMKEIQKDLQL